MDDVIIRFDKVTKAFGRNVIYEDLTMDVRRGETMTIIGGSGVGKSVAKAFAAAAAGFGTKGGGPRAC